MKSICFLVFISFSVLASSLEKVTSHLPQDVRKLVLHKTTPLEAQKILGKADLVEGKKYYWERNGFKYVLELTFDEKTKLSSLHYTFTDQRPTIEIDKKKLTPAGKYFRLKENNLEITLDPVSETIHSVKLL